MNWLVFMLLALAALILNEGLAPLWSLGQVTPMLPLILLAYVALLAPPRAVLWAALVLGVLVDLMQGPVAGVLVLGPTALAYFVGGLIILQYRGMVFRDSAVSLAVTTLVAGVMVQLIVVALYSLRAATFLGGDTLEAWSATAELWIRFQMVLYTAVLAWPVGMVLYRLTPIFGFGPRPRSDRYY